MFGNPETTPGGRALKFYASVRMDIRRIETLKPGTDAVGSRTRVKVVKNKVASPFRVAEFDIMYNEGISREGGLLDVGIAAGILSKTGAWFNYGDIRLGQGRENSRDFLKQNPEIAQQDRRRDSRQGREHRGRRRGHQRGGVAAIDGWRADPAQTAAEPADPAAAMEVAARFLGTRPRSRWEVERRLRRAGAANRPSRPTLERLTALGYVDDAAFARWWAEQRDRHAPRGRRMIEAELRQHGVPREVIEPFRDEHARPERAAEDAHLPSTEEDRARRSAGSSPARPPDADRARRRFSAIGMFLVRRGFDPDTVEVCVAAGEQRARDRRS